MRELASSIQQNLNVLHSTPRTIGLESRDFGIENGRLSIVTQTSSLANHCSDTKHDEQVDRNGT